MPLDRSHVIVFCTVSPVVLGLAAYYWYRSRRTIKPPTIVLEAPLAVVEEIDEEVVGSSEKMTRKSTEQGQFIPQSLDATPISHEQIISSKECNLQTSTPIESISENQQSFHNASLGSEDLGNEGQHVEPCLETENSNMYSLGTSTTDSSSNRVGSNFSDTHTEVSADSGVGNSSDHLVFRFDFPSDLVGLLIGNHGRNVKSLQEKSGARVRIERSDHTSRYQICVVEGL